MKNTIIALAASAVALGSVNAQTVSSGLITGATTFGDPGSTTFEFSSNGGSGTASATGTFTASAAAGRVLAFSRNSTGNPTNSGNLALTFSQAGQYEITLSDFDVTTASTQNLFATAGFSSFTTSSSGVAPGQFNATQISPIRIDLDVVGSGQNGPNGTNGSITLTYGNVQAGDTINLNFIDNNGFEDALAWSVTQLSTEVVPEPSSALLLGLGAFGLLGRRKR